MNGQGHTSSGCAPPPATAPRWQAVGRSSALQWQAHTHDADAQSQAQPDWALQYEQISAGAFAGHVHHIQLPGLRLVREDSNRALHQQGELGCGSFGLAMPLALSGPAIFSGQRVAQDHIMVGPSRR